MSDKSGKNSTEKDQPAAEGRETAQPQPKEIGGRKGPEPTRYGDWEKNGIISDF